MLLPRLGALLLAASYAHAFKNTSPFFLLSSEPLPSDSPLQSSQIALNSDLEERIVDTIQQCDSKWYYIFVQDYVTARDLKDGMPKLQGRMAGAAKSSLVEIPEVVPSGEMSAESIVSRLEKACEAKGKNNKALWPEKEDEYQYTIVEMPALPSEREARAKTLAETDDAMDDTVASVLSPKDASAVFIYITTPPPSEGATDQNGNVYEMDKPYPAVLQTDLKRDTGLHSRQSDDDNMQDGLPLFEKYQFLSPPIFMGLSVSILLLFILSVGVRAIAGLEVSYMAFSKEMGPQAQKPKQ